MYEPLIPCPSCARHVRARESACPFCAATLPADPGARAVPATPGRLGRAAAFFFGAAVTVAGCSTEVTTNATGDTTGGAGGASSGNGGHGGAGNATASGAGAGLPDAGPDDDGGGFVLYGDPPPPDAGDPPEDAGIQPPYGTPPPPPDK